MAFSAAAQAAAAQAAHNFEAAKHPRGSGGKFGEVAGGAEAPTSILPAALAALTGKTTGIKATDVILMNVADNPKRPGAKNHARFGEFRTGFAK